MISPSRLAAALRTDSLGRDLRVVDEAPSTMDLAHEAILAGAPDGWTVVAQRQTAGRGARGRVWSTREGASLPLSFVVRPMRAGAWLSLAVGLGLADTLARRGIDARVKWPNDVLVRDRKIAGILVEARSVGGRMPEAAVVGLGLNVRPHPYPADVAATDLQTELEASEDPISGRGALDAMGLERLVADLFEAIETWIDRAAHAPSAVARALDARLAWRGEAVVVDDVVRGRVLGVGDEGQLLLEGPNGTERIRAGQVRRARDVAS